MRTIVRLVALTAVLVNLVAPAHAQSSPPDGAFVVAPNTALWVITGSTRHLIQPAQVRDADLPRLAATVGAPISTLAEIGQTDTAAPITAQFYRTPAGTVWVVVGTFRYRVAPIPVSDDDLAPFAEDEAIVTAPPADLTPPTPAAPPRPATASRPAATPAPARSSTSSSEMARLAEEIAFLGGRTYTLHLCAMQDIRGGSLDGMVRAGKYIEQMKDLEDRVAATWPVAKAANHRSAMNAADELEFFWESALKYTELAYIAAYSPVLAAASGDIKKAVDALQEATTSFRQAYVQFQREVGGPPDPFPAQIRCG